MKVLPITCLLLIIATSSVNAASVVDFDYPPASLEKGCVLHKGLNVETKLSGMLYPLGSDVQTKHGKWTCIAAIARQSDGTQAGVWINKPYKRP